MQDFEGNKRMFWKEAKRERKDSALSSLLILIIIFNNNLQLTHVSLRRLIALLTLICA